MINLQNQDLPSLNISLNQIDQYLEQTEAPYNLCNQTNKIVVWHNNLQHQTEVSVIYLHGYSASRREIDPVPRLVAKALNANLFYTRFKGNGIQGGADSYKGVTAQDWYNDSLEALAIGLLLGKKVVIMGHSTGCTLGTWLSFYFKKYIQAQLYLAPNYKPSEKGAMLIAQPWGNFLLKLLKGNYYTYTDPDIKNEDNPIWSQTQHTDAIRAMILVVKEVQTLPLETLNVPLFIACSPHDKVVSTAYTQKIFERYGAKKTVHKELLLTENSTSYSQHTITGDTRDASTTQFIATKMIEFVSGS